MKSFKERNPLLIKILAVFLLVLMCCSLPSLFLWPLCLKQDLVRPPNTEVLVSACKRPVVRGVPGGDVLFVYEGRTEKMYLLDLRTGKKKDVPDDPLLLDKGIFLNSELAWLRGYTAPPGSTGTSTIPHFILDLTDGQRYELLDITWLPRLEGGKFDPKYYTYFQSAGQVFIHHTQNTLIALSSDFRNNPNGRVIFSYDGESLEQLMQDLEVGYEIVDLSLRYSDIPSPTGKYVVRNDNIYFSGTNVPVLTSQYLDGHIPRDYFKSWYYDESGIIVKEGITYLISSPLFGSYYPITTPVLKLSLPLQ